MLSELKEGQIRILRVEPESGTLPGVRCTLDVVSLSDGPDFFALSYTWGPSHPGVDQEHEFESQDVQADGKGQSNRAKDGGGVTGNQPRRCILCNGKDMLVTSNLYQFLLHCSRSPDQALHGPLWVDAISINQTDLVERRHQVSLMAQIYKAASHVIVWLGDEDDSTIHAFELIRALASLSGKERADLNSYSTHLTFDKPVSVGTNLVMDYDNCRRLAVLFERTWFSRAWIIQEIVFAQRITVFCGSQSMPWEDLATVSFFLATSGWSSLFEHGLSKQQNVTRWFKVPARLAAAKRTWKSTSRDGLLFALIRARSSACQDPRDKVYSQLSLGNARIPPRYDIPIAEVYISAAKYILEHSDNLFLLTCIEGEEFQTVLGLPSWVPDWSVTDFLGLRVTGYGSFRAASDRPRKFQVFNQDGKDILSVEAMKLDDIVEVAEHKKDLSRFSSDAMLQDQNPEVRSFWAIVSRLDEKYFTGQSREEVIWRTLMTNRESTSSTSSIQYPASKSLERSFRDWVLWCYVNLKGLLLDHSQMVEFPIRTLSDSILPAKEEILETIEECNANERLSVDLAQSASHFEAHYSHALLQRPFRTENGFFGLGTRALGTGDSVWIVPGCKVPLIFRKIEDSKRYRLVGGSYVHGFMDGEALERERLEFWMVELE